MEKEEKIRRAAQKENLLIKLSEWFGWIAFVLTLVVRVATAKLDFTITSYGLIYPILSLALVENPIAQGMVVALVHAGLNLALYNQSSISFEMLYCLILTIVNQGFVKNGQDDKFLAKLLAACLIFVSMVESQIFEYAPLTGHDPSFMSLFGKELGMTILVIYMCGPIKIYLDV